MFYAWPVIHTKRFANVTLSVGCVAFGVLAFYNVFAENAEVEPLARAAATCPTGTCQLTRLDRSPFAQTFEFQRRGETVTARCVRSAILLGPYGCKAVKK